MALARFCRCVVVLALGTALALPAAATPVPFGARSVNLTAREQPVADFLQDLFAPLDIPVIVSASVKGAVNGHFSGSAAEVYRGVARSFNLVEYFDGVVLHVHAPQDMVVRSIAAPGDQAEDLHRLLHDMHLPDARNTVRVTGPSALVVTGARRFAEQVDEIARAHTQQQRQRPAPSSVRVFYLRYAWAQDMVLQAGGRSAALPGVASLVRAVMQGEPRSRVVPGAGPSQPRGAAQRAHARPAANSAAGGQTLGVPGADPNAPSAPVLALQAGLKRPAEATAEKAAERAAPASEAPLAAAATDPRVEADARLNAVIVRDMPERMPLYEQLIASLDMEPQAIEIEATIVDVNTDRLRELGINWRLGDRHFSALTGRGDASDLALAPGTTPEQVIAEGRGGLLSAVLGNSLQFIARVQALQERGAAKVISSPQIITLSNVEALFDSSQTFYVRVAGRDEVDLFNVSAGTQLRVTPHVFKDAGEVRIKLMVAIEDGTLGARAVDGLPVVDRSSIDTQALIFEGESLLIGGITRQSTLDDKSQVPVLGDLPVVGGLFRSTRTGSSRIERMFLISPRLVPARRGPGSTLPAAAATPFPPTEAEDAGASAQRTRP